MRNLTSTIERTPEYNDFICRLSEFHAIKGTTLQTEPILGKKRLDLLKLFNIVVGIGGFDKVTHNRAWKQVGNQFGFPATCTNSAFVLKGLYIRNLYGYEKERISGKTRNPPKELERPLAQKANALIGSKDQIRTPHTIRKPSSPRKRSDKGNQRVQGMANSIERLINPLMAKLLGGPASLHGETLVETPVKEAIVDEPPKQKILFALRFGGDKDINWALTYLLDLTFSTPHHLLLSKTPTLIELLLDHGRPYIQHHEERQCGISSNSNSKDTLSSLMMDTGDSNESTTKVDRLRMVLHVIRNYAMIDSEAAKMATHDLFKELAIKVLDISVAANGVMDIGRTCIDIVKKMASHLPFAGPDDPWIPCLSRLILAQDRYLVVASIRALTVVGMCDLNHLFLNDNTQVIAGVAQNVLSADEELVGVSLEYIYQQVRASTDCRSQMLSAYGGAYVGILVDKLRFPSKYYVAKLIQDDIRTTAKTSASGFMQFPLSPGESTSRNCSWDEPTSSHFVLGNQHSPIPDLSRYATLEEPYRCLGWLKDKFEVTNDNRTLSLDDLYLLYYTTFGIKKALEINHFYSVLSIAFPEQPPSHIKENGLLIPNPSIQGTKINGLSIQGLQIKMNILLDEVKHQVQGLCPWGNCTDKVSLDALSLEAHILQDHAPFIKSGVPTCQWTGCHQVATKSRDEWILHLRQHIASTYTPSTSPSASANEFSPSIPLLPQHDAQPFTNDLCVVNELTPSSSGNSPNELTGISLIAIHLLRTLSEDPISIIYMAPYAVKLITTADKKQPLSPYVHAILLNLRTHSTVSSSRRRIL